MTLESADEKRLVDLRFGCRRRVNELEHGLSTHLPEKPFACRFNRREATPAGDQAHFAEELTGTSLGHLFYACIRSNQNLDFTLENHVKAFGKIVLSEYHITRMDMVKFREKQQFPDLILACPGKQRR